MGTNIFMKWLLKFGGTAGLSLGILYLVIKSILKMYSDKTGNEPDKKLLVAIFAICSITVVTIITIISPYPNNQGNADALDVTNKPPLSTVSIVTVSSNKESEKPIPTIETNNPTFTVVSSTDYDEKLKDLNVSLTDTGDDEQVKAWLKNPNSGYIQLADIIISTLNGHKLKKNYNNEMVPIKLINKYYTESKDIKVALLKAWNEKNQPPVDSFNQIQE